MLFLVREPVVKETPQKETPSYNLLLGAILTVNIMRLFRVRTLPSGAKLQSIENSSKYVSERLNHGFYEDLCCLC